MDIYHIWFNLKEGVKDTDFADSLKAYLDHLRSRKSLGAYRITRRKLGLGHPAFPEWHVWIELESLAQLDQAFHHVATRANPVESFHHAVNSKVTDLMFTLYRDFPDADRQRGQEKF